MVRVLARQSDIILVANKLIEADDAFGSIVLLTYNVSLFLALVGDVGVVEYKIDDWLLSRRKVGLADNHRRRLRPDKILRFSWLSHNLSWHSLLSSSSCLSVSHELVASPLYSLKAD